VPARDAASVVDAGEAVLIGVTSSSAPLQVELLLVRLRVGLCWRDEQRGQLLSPVTGYAVMEASSQTPCMSVLIRQKDRRSRSMFPRPASPFWDEAKSLRQGGPSGFVSCQSLTT
jgi:hypothetical protein